MELFCAQDHTSVTITVKKNEKSIGRINEGIIQNDRALYFYCGSYSTLYCRYSSFPKNGKNLCGCDLMGSKKIMHTQTIDALIDTINYTHKQIQSEAIKSVSRSLTFRNWIIGYYIVEYEQNGKDRAMYGDRLNEFDIRLLTIQQTVSAGLQIPPKKLINSFTFSHFIELLKIDDDSKRTFYEVETINGNWSVRELKRQINSQTYERVG